ncbi:MAG: helix-turn-helix transcriptional regulator [Moritella sp.]|uniref:helix-turn-helix domain-containing protein n=1 Tax=Moritella sp. TaxID=78556 RepID=UPI0025D5A605|nr:helix-turn-helix transcriptional regulator [Moritella sp.]NQZ92470.1 helix-turn-helix transcriptional regulator [Moritella sp.]
MPIKNKSIKPLLSYYIHPGWMNLLTKAADKVNIDTSDGISNRIMASELTTNMDVRDIRDFHYQLYLNSGDPTFTLDAAKQVTPLTFDSYSLCLWTCPDLLTLLKDAAAFCITLGSPIRLSFHLTPQGDAEIWLFNQEPLNKESHITHLGGTLYLATLVQIIHETTGHQLDELAVKLITWPYDDNRLAEFEKTMRCQISTSSPVRKIHIMRKYLHRPLVTQNPEIYASARSLLLNKAAQLEADDILLQVYNTLDKQANLENLSAESIASQMLFSVRTLNRRLAEVGMSYRSVVEKYKLEKALQLLNQPHRNITEIAFHLGFADLSTFSRAFKRWTGCSPTKST